MSAQSSAGDALHAEPAIAKLLQRIDASQPVLASDAREGVVGRESTLEFSQQRADELLARIAWCRLAEPGDGVAGGLLAALGARAALALLVQHPTAAMLINVAAEEQLELSSKAAEDALGRWLPRLNRGETIDDIERAAAKQLRVVLPGDELWPDSLDALELHAPNMLWVRGEPAHLSSISLGVVGARAATGYGTHVTAELVEGVCAAGITIVSGAAYGIDAVAHRTALATSTPTIAVVAGGADRPYPQAHEQLLTRISDTGAVCSEMVPGSAPTKWRFLMRNRLIAALSQATLVTEAGMNSGSLNTAGHAAQLGRPIGAVPGPVTSAASAGCHRLLREYGATLITNAREACELLGVNDELAILAGDDLDAGDAQEQRDSAWIRRVLDALPLKGARDLTDIARRAGLTEEQVMGVLAELELLGRVQRREKPGEATPKWALGVRQ